MQYEKNNLLERALELARTGHFHSMKALRARLKQEGYTIEDIRESFRFAAIDL